MSETVTVLDEKRKYINKLYQHLKDYVSNLVEAKILDRKAKEASGAERAERRELLNARKVLLNSNNFDIDEFREIMRKIGDLNKRIAEIERPFRVQAKMYIDAQKKAFNELIKTMVFNGDLDLNKVVEAGLIKVK
jgi:hypothetical protein